MDGNSGAISGKLKSLARIPVAVPISQQAEPDQKSKPLPSGFVLLNGIDESILTEICYATASNVVEK